MGEGKYSRQSTYSIVEIADMDVTVTPTTGTAEAELKLHINDYLEPKIQLLALSVAIQQTAAETKTTFFYDVDQTGYIRISGITTPINDPDDEKLVEKIVTLITTGYKRYLKGLQETKNR
jgi:hypothetical protein